MQWENINDYYYAWGIYLAGAAGCSLAAWFFIRGLPRAVVHFFVITVVALLFTPFALDAKNMVLAPAIVFIAYGTITEGFASIKPVLKTVIIVWAAAIVLSLIYQLLTRNWYRARMERRLEQESEDYYEPEENRDVPGFDPKRNGFYPPKHTSLPGEIPIRAER